MGAGGLRSGVHSWEGVWALRVGSWQRGGVGVHLGCTRGGGGWELCADAAFSWAVARRRPVAGVLPNLRQACHSEAAEVERNGGAVSAAACSKAAPSRGAAARGPGYGYHAVALSTTQRWLQRLAGLPVPP